MCSPSTEGGRLLREKAISQTLTDANGANGPQPCRRVRSFDRNCSVPKLSLRVFSLLALILTLGRLWAETWVEVK